MASELYIKTGRRRGFSKSKFLNWSGLQPAIPIEIRDVDLIKTFFQEYGEVFVPYATMDHDTSHSLLHLLIHLSSMNTQGACRDRIGEHITGGQWMVKYNKRSDCFIKGLEEQTPSVQEQESFRDYIIENIHFHLCDGSEVGILEFSRYVYQDVFACGNAWVEKVDINIAGVKRVEYHLHKPQDVLLLATRKNEPRFGGISPVWTNEYVRKYPARILPIYPMFESDGGVRRSLIHVKTGNQYWYGRPYTMGSLFYQYRQFQDANFSTKLARNNFTAHTVLEVEGEELSGTSIDGLEEEAQDAGFDDLAERMEQNFSQKSDDPQTFMLIERPYGTRPMASVDIKHNFTADFYKTSDEVARRKIIEVAGWSERLLSGDVASAFSSNVFADDLRTKKATLQSYERFLLRLLNDICIRTANKFMGREEMNNYSVQFKTPYFDLLSQNNEDDIDDNNTVGGSGVRGGK